MTDARPSTNGTNTNATTNGADPATFDKSNILQALDISHNPATDNEVRLDALRYIEKVKSSKEAPQYGFTLSTDRSQPPLVRHFGLSLLSHVIRHAGHHLSEQENAQLRDCVLDLGRSIWPSDPAFIRNKIAELWIELAKRSWALDWFDLDEQLVRLWSSQEPDLMYKDFVLTVLENLSEDIFIRDDTIAVLRGHDLNSALVEIFTSSANYAGGIRIGETTHHVRFGDEGWLTRIKRFLDQVVVQEPQQIAGALKDTTLKALATLRSAFSWVMTPAVVHSMALPVTCNFLTQSDSDLVMAAVDCLMSLYGRNRLEEVEVQALVHPLIQPDSVSTLGQLYSWSVVSVDEIDSAKYTISKKLSELMSLLADHLHQYAPPAPNVVDLSPFLHLLIVIAEHQSLIVSIPVVHSWVKILERPSWSRTAVVSQCVGQLLQVASQRLIQYDQLPEDARDPVVVFVNEEIELFPERQGFYMNYRRLCSAVVEWICYAQLDEAMRAVLQRADELLDETEAWERQSFNVEGYERTSTHVLQADAHFAMIDAAFKGLDRWQAVHHRDEDHATAEELEVGSRTRDMARSWMLDMMARRQFADPQVRQRQIKTAVEVSNRALRRDTGFAFHVLEHILSSFAVAPPSTTSGAYTEAVAELHSYATGELRRLALQHADYFVTFYDQLESKFSDLINQIGGADDRLQVDLKATLFSIVQRATITASDYADRQARLEPFLRPLASAWADPGLETTLGSFDSFAHSQAFDRVAPFLESIRAADVADWSSVAFDERGAQIQRDMAAGFARLPLRETRVLLAVSTERLEPGSNAHRLACALWSPLVPGVLTHVLRLTAYNHQLHNPRAWPNVTAELEAVVRRVLRDRYWQSGISTGSMNEFHSRVKLTRATLEGFASSVRGRIRNNLEQCYGILHTLGRLGSVFYGLPGLPDMIAEAAVDTTSHLGPHHFSVVIQMLPKLIDECPPSNRQQFLTPILSSLLTQLDTKLTAEWVDMDARKQDRHDEENLGDEMRDDSVLRQTTYRAVNMVAQWLNSDRKETGMREFLLSNVQLVDRLLVFVAHALAFRDLRSCHAMLAAVLRLVPEFATDRFVAGQEAAAVREFFSSEILKTAITCLHDGYFADHQQHYAQLIATIWVYYGLPTAGGSTDALTSTPRDVLLSLPGVTPSKVDHAAAQLVHERARMRPRKLRAVVLALLEGVRGVRLSELGKIDTRPQQSRILEKYKHREFMGGGGADGNGNTQTNGADKQNTDDGVDLGGVADMFGGS